MRRPEDIMATIELILRGSYNQFGRERWWSRERTQLDGKTPREMFKTDPQRVLELAEWLWR